MERASGTASRSPDDLAQIKDEAAWEEVKRDAKLVGELRGKLVGVRAVLVQLPHAAGLSLEEGDLTRINACEDLATLQQWTLRLVGAKQTAERQELCQPQTRFRDLSAHDFSGFAGPIETSGALLHSLSYQVGSRRGV